MKVTKNMKLLVVFIVLLSLCLRVHAFSGKTHKGLTQNATLSSRTSAYLKNSLGIKQGVAWKVTLDQSILPPGDRVPVEQCEERISGE
jgi:hypothetical protein